MPKIEHSISDMMIHNPMDSYRKFRYLYLKDNRDAKSEDVLECVYDSPERLGGKFVMQSEAPRMYYVFNSWEDAKSYIEDCDIEKRMFHEVIFGWQPQKIKFDIDIKDEEEIVAMDIQVPADNVCQKPPIADFIVDDDFLKRVIDGDVPLTNPDDNILRCTPEDIVAKFSGDSDSYRKLTTVAEKVEHIIQQVDAAIVNTFYLTYFTAIGDRDIVTCSSSGRESSRRYKHSYHKIIDGWFVSSNVEAKLFTDLVINSIDPRFRKYVDSVNKSTQEFRIVGCHKEASDRVKKVVSCHHDDDTIITVVDRCQRLPSNVDFLEATDRVGKVDFHSQISKMDAKRIEEKVQPYTEGHTLREQKGNMFIYQRDRPTDCLICEEVHHRDSTLYITCGGYDGVIRMYMNCRHKTGVSKLLGEIISDAIAGEMTIDRKDFAGDRLHAKTSEASLRKSIKTTNGKSVEIITMFDTLPDIQKTVYCEPALRAFELIDTLCVKAKMKMGKTKKLREFIDTHFAPTGLRVPIVRILSFRQTFSGNIKEKFPDFTLYSDVKGELDQPRLICQIESLHRVEISRDIDPPDLLVMDECESIFEQFESGLLKNFSMAWATFQWMIRNARYIVCMDANLSDRTYRLLKRMRIDYHNAKYPTEPSWNIYYHNDKYKNQTGDRYYFTTDKNKWYYMLHSAVADGSRIVCPMSSLGEAEVLKRDIEQNFPENTIGFYSSKTSASQKREHFNNVAEYWSQYDTLIYTPTVSAGVSYEEKHFDKIFAYFTDKACNVETCLQMLGRIRNVGCSEYYICLNSSRNNLPTDVDDIKGCVNNRRMNLFRQFDTSLLNIEYEDNGDIKCHSSDYFYLWLENTRIRNLSLNDFNNRMIRYIAEGGAHCGVIDVNVPDETLATIAKRRRGIKVELSEENIKNIADSTDLDEEGVDNIQAKFIQQVDISEPELHSYEKYKLRRDYKWDGAIDDTFVKKYNNRKSRRVYKNLSRILSKRTLEEALDSIKRDERANYMSIMEQDEKYQHSDFNRKYMFDQHRIAIGFLKTCGFENIIEQYVVSESKLFDNFRREERQIADALYLVREEFEFKNMKHGDVRYSNQMTEGAYVLKLLKYINRIFSAMYDIRIAPDKTDKRVYRLKYSGLFNIGKPAGAIETDKPYIETWSPDRPDEILPL